MLFVFVSIIIQRFSPLPNQSNILSEPEKLCSHVHPKTLIEMWIICLDPVSANSERVEIAVEIHAERSNESGTNCRVSASN